jgi:N-acylneuraminate cytidylyltransferase/CMP-N,N'-diacetyllegionaminic acid synthase
MASVLWLVAARAGSKGIPDKNVKTLAGRPLMSYVIRSALSLARPGDVWVSTDSPRYASLARRLGATVPFLRPARLATDKALSADVVRHAMDWAEAHGGARDYIGLLEPTAPFVPAAELRRAVERLARIPRAEAVVAVRPVRPSTFYVQPETPYLDVLARRLSRKGTLRRQDEREEITPSGGFYIARWAAFRRRGTFYTPRTLAHRLDGAAGLEIDEPMDWAWAEFLLRTGRAGRGRAV